MKKPLIADWKKSDVTKAWTASNFHSQGRHLAVANGTFDVGLHAGHLRTLSWIFSRRWLARPGEIVQVVLLNSDESVRKIKSPHRPVQPFDERAAALLELDWVSAVIGFNELTPDDLIKYLVPDILVKGAEYVNKEVPGLATVVAHGGMILFVPFARTEKGVCYSSSRLIEQVQSSSKY
jgi:rfaE bifunctional protein nucleotidyltransferase chain/domain